MLNQSIDQLFPVLELLQQPAFCIRHDGTVICNFAAQNLAPNSASDLQSWLEDSWILYQLWDRASGLELPLTRINVTVTVTIQALEDGELFLISHNSMYTQDHLALSVAAQVMRLPLSELSIMSQRLFAKLDEIENPAIQQHTAAMNQQLYRLMRLASNLSDLERIRAKQVNLDMTLLDLQAFFDSIEQEYVHLCRDAGKTLEIIPPKKPVRVFADRDLLERMIANLISNAVKFGSDDAPITLWVDVRDSAVLIRIRNHCTKLSSDLLSAAFSRIEQRGIMPDPQWGLGVGLPLVRHIAQLHNGTAALEAGDDGYVTVTVSLSRGRAKRECIVKSPIVHYRTGGVRRSLLELSDVLPPSTFSNPSL